MRKVIPVAFLFFAVVLLVSPIAGAAETTRIDRDAPIRITADSMTSDLASGVTVFEKNVIIVQKDVTIRADRVEVYSEGEQEDNRELTRIVAIGNVSFHQEPADGRREINASGDRGFYLRDEDTVTLTGNPRLWQGKNWVTGKKMIFRLGTDLYEVEGEEEKPIRAVYYPPPEKESSEPAPPSLDPEQNHVPSP